jgi:hypothetical protein
MLSREPYLQDCIAVLWFFKHFISYTYIHTYIYIYIERERERERERRYMSQSVFEILC